MEKSQAVKEQMTKFGWKEGQGLGKNEQGIKEAIKVSLKNNKNGLGLDPSEQFVFHWWDHVFNKVASSIKIDDIDGEVCFIDGHLILFKIAYFIPIQTSFMLFPR